MFMFIEKVDNRRFLHLLASVVSVCLVRQGRVLLPAFPSISINAAARQFGSSIPSWCASAFVFVSIYFAGLQVLRSQFKRNGEFLKCLTKVL